MNYLYSLNIFIKWFDVSVIKSAVKHISNEVVDVSDKMEFISMKEFNNERDFFLMKKKNSHKDSNLD